MMQTLFTWWQGRSERERQLLAALGAVAATILLWAIFVALGNARDAARERHAAAGAELQNVRAIAAAIAGSAGKPAQAGGIVADRVTTSASSAGLEFSSSTPDDNGGLGVSIAAVKPTFLFGWIATLEQDHGVVVSSLAVRRNGDATVSAEIGFAGASE